MAARIVTAVVLLLAMTGCAKVHTHHWTMPSVPETETRVADAGSTIPFSPVPGLKCAASDVRPTWHVTAGVIACWDATGKLVISGVVPGQALITTGMQAIGAASAVAGPVGGAMILGNKMIDAAKVIDGAAISATTSGSVTTTGTVGVTIPPVSVNPVSGSFSLVPVVP